MICGLDISTSVVGISILSNIGEIVLLDYVQFKKQDTLWDKVDKMHSFFSDIKKQYPIEHVFIEEPLSKFRRGASSSHTISLLIKFNGICSYFVHKIFQIDPFYINAGDARKTCGLIMKNKTACKKAKIIWKPQKQQAFEQMNAQPPFSEGWEWEKKRTGRFKDYCYDMMDAYIVSKAGFIKNGQKQ